MSKQIKNETTTGETFEGNFQYNELDQRRINKIIQIQAGAIWILQAIVINEIRHGNITLKSIKKGNLDKILSKHTFKLQEIREQLEFAETLRYLVEKSAMPTPETVNEKIDNFLFERFVELTLDTLEAREKLSTCNIVMVAGQQGVGKTAVIDFFGSKGYEIVSMSQIIREMLEAWGLDPTETVDKMVGGKRARAYFGSDILVQLALHYLVSEGKTKMVIDGPRSVGEAEAVVDLGGILIGVKAVDDVEKDQEIRRQRIIGRAQIDPSRTADVENFPTREKAEFENIDKILQMVKPENIILNEGVSTEELLQQLEARFASINAERPRGNI